MSYRGLLDTNLVCLDLVLLPLVPRDLIDNGRNPPKRLPLRVELEVEETVTTFGFETFELETFEAEVALFILELTNLWLALSSLNTPGPAARDDEVEPPEGGQDEDEEEEANLLSLSDLEARNTLPPPLLVVRFRAALLPLGLLLPDLPDLTDLLGL